MKSQKGVTLTSLVIYIIVVLVVVGILSAITLNFQNGVKEMNKQGTSNSEIDKFNLYFLKEAKKQGNEVGSVNDVEILFTSGNKYTYKDDKAIYLNDNIKIAEDIEKCIFTSSLVNGKTVITVTIKARNTEEKSVEYVLSNKAGYSSYEDEESYTSKEDNNTANTVSDLNSDSNNSNEIINNI